ncbi:MAG: prolipoprotein diacylglyceryl transferase [Candidatus Dadabacteria bacterium]|nr:prolipoprotein diacylglyceryl transferase [Candidatus Dadabacteria bacterium]
MYPVLFQIGDISISSYTVMLIIGFLAAYLLCRGEFKRKGLDEELLDLLFLGCVLGGVIGAKVFFLIEKVSFNEFMSDPMRYLSSGLASLGGFICAFILFWIIVRIKNVSFWLATDAMAPIVVLYPIARIGCFLVGDDYGIPSTLPWAMSFPEGSPPTNERVHPTQIYEMLAFTVIFIFVWKIRKKDMPIGWLSGVILVLFGLERIFVEFLRNATPSFIPGVSIVQLISLGVLLAGILKILEIRIREKKPKKGYA